MDSATDDDEAVAPSGSQTNLSRKTLLRDTDDIGIHGDGESTCSSDETYSGPREKFLFNEVIDSQKPSDAPTSSIPPAEQDMNQPSAEWTRICAKILRQDRNAANSHPMQDAINLEQLRGSWKSNPVATGLVAAATSGLTDVQAITMDALRFIRGVDAYGTDIANAGESTSTAHHNALLKEFAADIPMVSEASSMSVQQLVASAECLAKDSSIDHRIILPQVTQEPPVDTTAEDEEIALLLYEQLKKRC
ncbi:hypothetical protein N7499_005495 [Penicillium canescens]|nr:hypothetical protein N7499_005495 [Penicillium canescens]